MHGIIIGKFYPLHKGHCYLINYALSFCDELSVFLCSKKNEHFSGEMRVKWMHQEFPELNVYHITKEVSEAHSKNPDAPEIWSEELKSILGSKSVDFVIASEDYGDRLARLLGAKFLMLDGMRSVVPISGSEIRKNLYNNWTFLADSVKEDLSRIICLEGVQDKIFSIVQSLNSLYVDSLMLFVEDEVDAKLVKKNILARISACKKLGYPFVLCCVNNCSEHVNKILAKECGLVFSVTEDSDIMYISEQIKSLLG